MSEETWGPWTEHVPGPCPVPVGTLIQIRDKYGRGTGRIVPGRGAYGVDHVGWLICPYKLEYRIKMDREHSGMSVLRELLKGIPVKETEDA